MKKVNILLATITLNSLSYASLERFKAIAIECSDLESKAQTIEQAFELVAKAIDGTDRVYDVVRSVSALRVQVEEMRSNVSDIEIKISTIQNVLGKVVAVLKALRRKEGTDHKVLKSITRELREIIRMLPYDEDTKAGLMKTLGNLHI